MSSNRLGELIRIADEVTNKKFGYPPYDRPIKELLNYGIILLDKPGGPTSHEVVAWVKRILELEKAGHSGTLDPGATGFFVPIAGGFCAYAALSSAAIFRVKGAPSTR